MAGEDVDRIARSTNASAVPGSSSRSSSAAKPSNLSAEFAEREFRDWHATAGKPDEPSRWLR